MPPILLDFRSFIWYNNVVNTTVIQCFSEHFVCPTCFKFGIALGSGPRGPGFESRCSDQKESPPFRWAFFFARMAGIRTIKCKLSGGQLLADGSTEATP